MRKLLLWAGTGGMACIWVFNYGGSKNDPDFYNPEYFGYRMLAYAMLFTAGFLAVFALGGVRLLWRRFIGRPSGPQLPPRSRT